MRQPRGVGFIVGGAGEGKGVVDDLCAGGVLVADAAAFEGIMVDDDLRANLADNLSHGADHLRILHDDAVVKAEEDHILLRDAETGARFNDFLFLIVPARRLDGIEVGLFLGGYLAPSEFLGKHGIVNAKAAGERDADHAVTCGDMTGPACRRSGRTHLRDGRR